MRWVTFAIAAVAVGLEVETVAAQPESVNTNNALTGTAAIGKELYEARCSNCHSNKAGESNLAPTLNSVIGRKAGGVEGFPYSEKISKLELTWSPESLGAWLSSQSLDSPILRMRHLGVTDPGEVQMLVEYLGTLKD